MRLMAMFGLAFSGALLAGCVETTEVATVSMAPDLNSPAARACRTAIAKQVGKSEADVAIFETTFSEAARDVRATVAGAEAPWRCLSSNSGIVQQVMYTGSEGAL